MIRPSGKDPIDLPNMLFVGSKVRLTGHYMTVWRKDGGAWKVIADMGTTDPAKK